MSKPKVLGIRKKGSTSAHLVISEDWFQGPPGWSPDDPVRPPGGWPWENVVESCYAFDHLRTSLDLDLTLQRSPVRGAGLQIEADWSAEVRALSDRVCLEEPQEENPDADNTFTSSSELLSNEGGVFRARARLEMVTMTGLCNCGITCNTHCEDPDIDVCTACPNKEDACQRNGGIVIQTPGSQPIDVHLPTGGSVAANCNGVFDVYDILTLSQQFSEGGPNPLEGLEDCLNEILAARNFFCCPPPFLNGRDGLNTFLTAWKRESIEQNNCP